ncbi:type III secretion protein [Vibrio aquaticus]|uniref:Type III secretion protein n=1 Tax=Vibrio aquaticus TaxID=2496559 RepID=A0A432CXS2_9VIBR|nr:FHIPEP family type III secretion protein [Vibrio aquaticus]RTZ16653.1 type III secretion protein [Vibrio aquaticus]
MNKFKSFNLSSILIALLLPVVILVSLPGMIIDGLILISFISSTLLLVIMLDNSDPLKVTFLPTFVLLLTTFRLLLSIATTRNIIANEDVGNVIATVGDFVMDGNLISGLLIFVIITIVQFLVVTKGSERVAEVGARFSLDALPGRQMTIDSDLKSGLITNEEAQTLRANLATENKLFGSLDGAMKFVKGDSIAGILISLVNLFGGIYVGINQFGLSLGESVDLFSVLTIGDGLVSQIPSLLLSVACGVYLTRIKGQSEKKQSYISQVATQITDTWLVIAFCAMILLITAIFVPSLSVIAIIIAIILGGISFYLHWYSKSSSETVVNFEPKGSGIYESLKFVLKDADVQPVIKERLDDIESKLWKEKLGTPAIIIDKEIENDIEVYISNLHVYSFNSSNSQELVSILDDEIFIQYSDLKDNISSIANYFIYRQFVNKYNLQISSNIVDGLAVKSDVMKSELESAIGINRVHDVLKEMIRSPEFYLDQVSFFESLIYWSRIDNDPNNWFQRIREQAKYDITSRLITKEGGIYVAIFSPFVTELITDFVTGENEDFEELISLREKTKAEIVRLTKQFGSRPTILVNPTELSIVKRFIQDFIFTINVCSYSDITDQSRIVSTETISLPNV